MNRKEHLLVILAEECNEVGQRATKALRFGVNEIQPGTSNENNAERLKYEYNDLIAIVEILQEEGVLPPEMFSREMIDKKKERVKYFLEYSKKIGTLQE